MFQQNLLFYSFESFCTKFLIDFFFILLAPLFTVLWSFWCLIFTKSMIWSGPHFLGMPDSLPKMLWSTPPPHAGRPWQACNNLISWPLHNSGCTKNNVYHIYFGQVSIAKCIDSETIITHLNENWPERDFRLVGI